MIIIMIDHYNRNQEKSRILNADFEGRQVFTKLKFVDKLLYPRFALYSAKLLNTKNYKEYIFL